MKRNSMMLPVVASVLLSACASKPLNVQTPDPAHQRLAEAAEAIGKYRAQTASLSSAKYEKEHGARPTYDLANAPELTQLVRLADVYSGPLEALMIEMSAVLGWDEPLFKGYKPASDVMITVDTNYRRVIDILSDAGFMSGDRAHVHISTVDKRITIEYMK